MCLISTGCPRIRGSTYEDDYEIQDRPKAGEIFAETERQPFQQHLDAEKGAESEVRPIQNSLQKRIVI